MPLSRYLSMLEESGKNLLVFCDEEVIFSSSSKGVAPLIEAIDSIGRYRLRGTVTADRIVGKAAALLNAYMEVREVHALLISAAAKKTLTDHGLRFVFLEETEAIKSPDGVLSCPFERLVRDISDPNEAYVMIKAKLAG